MKKIVILAAALLVAAPAAAQESPGSEPTVAQSLTVQAQEATQSATPSIFVSRAEVQQRVAAMEAERDGAQVRSGSFLYMVAAIALGVLIALLLID